MSFFLRSLKESGHLDHLHFTICSVGSRKLEERDDYGSQHWNLLAPNLTIYGFDADADACDAANAELEERAICWTEQHIPLVITKQVGELTLYVTQNPACSSLYSPNEAFLARFVGLPEMVNLDFTTELEATTLDTFCQQEGIEEIDFLQLDVQGAELQVLEGASQIVKNSVLAIQTEVSFSELYINQPLFSEVDTYLRSFGFALFDFDLDAARRVRRISPIQAKRRPGQLLWADAFYLCDPIKDIENVRLQSPENLLKLACIADILGFADYALELLEHLTLKYGDNPRYNVANCIMSCLTQVPEVVQQGLDSLPIFANLKDFITWND
ncbi:FkbM family methyltransferase [Leptolyngbya sp. FACHB-541]|uniref:FkbM family methyltransferase n=1 Tax=Leptolyngbya sp. FACHB-541 TaxID=2692810 RepID=UPI0016876121|nr:FkbM family methyltransferase [Leptolyngbya sp. FACHB-541]MBD1996777.1 FkbM family methyltransferase [Leptolyngbya sp. FACHB-541]